MSNKIEAIFLDVGNTLRVLLKEEDHRSKARKELSRLTGATVSPEDLCEELDRRYKTYRKWAFENLTEASEYDLWTKWLAPDFPSEKIAPNVHELTFQFRQSSGRRVNADGGKEVVIELHRRGYVMGIISNVITTQEIPDWLEADGLSGYFKSVVLSSVFGRRKPHPSIYLEAARLAEVAPQNCVYVGDNFSRDVVGTRDAGFGMVIIMPDQAERDISVPPENQPDLIINSLRELLDYFPDRILAS